MSAPVEPGQQVSNPTKKDLGMQATIEVNGLCKRFGPTLALDGMSFTVQPGQVTGFVGPNGAGKSTTMRVILTLDAPDEGNATTAAPPYPTPPHPIPTLALP